MVVDDWRAMRSSMSERITIRGNLNRIWCWLSRSRTQSCRPKRKKLVDRKEEREEEMGRRARVETQGSGEGGTGAG